MLPRIHGANNLAGFENLSQVVTHLFLLYKNILDEYWHA